MVTITYAVRSSVIKENSAIAFAVGNDVQAGIISGQGIGLEALAVIRALVHAKKIGASDVQVLASEQLCAALEGKARLRQVQNLQGFLKGYPVDIVPGLAPQEVHDALASYPAPVLEHLLDDEDLLWVLENDATIVYTDGGSQNETFGSWAWYIDDERYDSGPVSHVAGSLASERYAIKQALEAIEGPVLVLSDRCDILYAFDAQLDALGIEDPAHALRSAKGERARFTFVKGHAEHQGNIAADRLVTESLASFADHLKENHDLRKQIEADAAKAAVLTAPYRERIKIERDWCVERLKEILHERYPHWSDLPRRERHRLSDELYAEARTEYLALPALVAA